MPSDPTTAAELLALVSQWPEEARSEHVEVDDVAAWTKHGGRHMSITHTIDLHIASGIKFLYRHCDVDCITITTDTPIMSKEATRIEMDLFQDPALRNRTRPGAANHEAPTLFLALHAAIIATKGGGK
jgi:hypothetical protein